jgi:hypothetical protein
VGLGEDGAGLVYVGHGHADARTVAEGEVDCRGEGDLSAGGGDEEAGRCEETEDE